MRGNKAPYPAAVWTPQPWTARWQASRDPKNEKELASERRGRRHLRQSKQHVLSMQKLLVFPYVWSTEWDGHWQEMMLNWCGQRADRTVSFLMIVVFQSLSHVQFLGTSWTAARQGPLPSTISWNLLKFMSIESVKLSLPLTISSSAAAFSCLQSFPASGSFPVSRLLISGGRSIGDEDKIYISRQFTTSLRYSDMALSSISILSQWLWATSLSFRGFFPFFKTI